MPVAPSSATVLAVEALLRGEGGSASLSSASLPSSTSLSLDSHSRSRSRSSSLSSTSSLSDLSSSEDEQPASAGTKRTKCQQKKRKVDLNRWLQAVDDPRWGSDRKEYWIEGFYTAHSHRKPVADLARLPRAASIAARTALLPRVPSHDSSLHSPSLHGPATIKIARTSHPSPVFPLPLFYGAVLLSESRDFRLPFDIGRDLWYDGATSRVGPKAGVVTMSDAERLAFERSRRPDRYVKITKNSYVARKADTLEEPVICDCRTAIDGEDGCGSTCINRMMQYFCDVKLCRLGPKCTNLPFHQRVGVPEGKDGLTVIWTGNRGFGLKTTVDIAEGSFLLDYRGEIISRNESYRRVGTVYKSWSSFYFLEYDDGEFVDAGTKGNAARFINHSCGPNVMIERWKLANVDEYQIGVFAKRDIAAGEELSYDYGWQDFSTLASPKSTLPPTPIELSTATTAFAPVISDDPCTDVADPTDSSDSAASQPMLRQRCYCGASVCSGFLGVRKDAIKKDLAVKKEVNKKQKGKSGK